jgi:hypothetical protein
VTLTRKVTAARWTFVISKEGKIASKNTTLLADPQRRVGRTET